MPDQSTPKVEYICETCGESFYRWPSAAGRFCSLPCYHASLKLLRGAANPRTQQVECVCEICGATFKTTPSRVAKGRGKYCSKPCYYEAMRRKPPEETPRWKGGVRIPTDSGYRMERVGTGYKREHRRIMGELLGRPLRDDEEVHHVNGDRADNRLENLQVMTVFEHKSLHARLRGGVRGKKSV